MTKETELKHAIKDYLKINHVFNFPILQGLAAYKGIPDRIAIKDGVAYALEVKAPKGKMSEYQIAFKQDWEAGGGVYLEVRQIEDLFKYF